MAEEYQRTPEEMEDLEERARMGTFYKEEAERMALALRRIDPENKALKSPPWPEFFDERDKLAEAAAKGESVSGMSPSSREVSMALAGDQPVPLDKLAWEGGVGVKS